MSEPVRTGVIGTGNMGQHHARVYDELRGAELVGIHDVDPKRAAEVASQYETQPCGVDELLEAADAVSIAVPTEYHFELATQCLDAGVGALIEKPVVADPTRGEELLALEETSEVPLQVGHIERFNPAVRAISDWVRELEVLEVRALRLGPQPDRYIADSAVLDLMIHDLDIVLSLLGQTPTAVHGAGVEENCHASALLEFGEGTMASLTASRRTQRKVRRLEITARECFVEVDYMDQSVEVYRDSAPEYVAEGGNVHFSEQTIVERPTIRTDEPLKLELESFVETVREGGVPEVSVADGLSALEVALEVEERALQSETVEVPADD